MKAKFIFSVIVIAALCGGKANAQIMPAIKKVTLLEQDKAALNQHLNEYAAFTIDKGALIDSLYKNGSCRFQIRIDEQRNWTLDLQFNEMRAPDYKQTYISDKGKFEQEKDKLNIFKGRTSNNQVARFTIDENNFFGIILDNREHYVIRPAKDYTKNSTDESLIVYKSTDIILKNEPSDYINDALKVPKDSIKQDIMMRSTAATSNNPCNYYLKIATDADYDFFQEMNSNSTNTNNYILSVLNVVEGIYESTFDLRFIVTYQNVWTTTPSGYPYTSTISSTLLGQFRTYWNNNMTGVSRHIAHLFTGKDLY